MAGLLRYEDGYFASSNGKDHIYYGIYFPAGEPKAVIQIAHGMAEHIGRYRLFAETMADNGYVVFANDHLGHGKSVEKDENLGYFNDENGWINMVDDLYRLTLLARERYPELPYFLLGHSMGSLLGRAYITCHGNELTGVLLLGTSGYNPLAKTAMPAVNAIGKIKGEKYRSRFLYNVAFGGYNKKYEKGSRKLAWMTRDDQALDLFKEDEKCDFIFTVSGFRDLMKLLNFVTRKEWATEIPAELPIVLLSGDMDPVGDFGEGVRQVFKEIQKNKVIDISLKLYPGLRHEILNEPEKEKVFQDILHWIESRI